MEIKIAYLSLGSNLGDKTKNLTHAIQLIELKIGEVIKISSVYETEALGFISNEVFNNCCLKIKTTYSPNQLLQKTQEIETEMGRKKKSKEGKYESRIIDIDIILYEDKIIKSKKLILPHPRYQQRNFVLFPLEEIDSEKIDPINQLTLSQLKLNSPDFSHIKRLKTAFCLKKDN